MSPPRTSKDCWPGPSTSAEWRYKRIPTRDDTAEIRHQCHVDSSDQRQFDPAFNTLYRDTYVRHPLDTRSPGPPLEPGIHIGGGNLAPPAEEMRTSDYGRFFNRPFDHGSVPTRASGVPPADIFPHDDAGPMGTVAHLAMQEASDNRPPYDNRDAKSRTADARSAHFYFGDDRPSYQTNYRENYGRRKTERPPLAANLGLQRASIEFDRDAGLGPNTRRLQKRDTFPRVPDAATPDVLHRNFDMGYDTPDYQTTTEASLQTGRRGATREAAVRAPECAELATHGAAARPWETTYVSDFKRYPMDPTDIDQTDLRETHFDLGYDPNDWQRNQQATASGAPPHEFMDLQASNPVFRGDGQMQFGTTNRELVGTYDRSLDGRGEQAPDCRGSHLFLGRDAPSYTTTARDANRCAGTGRPAQPAQDLHRLRGVGFARGGAWGPHATTKTDVDEKQPSEYARAETVDGRYFKGTHFDLNATEPTTGIYETTYFEEICRPQLVDRDC